MNTVVHSVKGQETLPYRLCNLPCKAQKKLERCTQPAQLLNRDQTADEDCNHHVGVYNSQLGLTIMREIPGGNDQMVAAIMLPKAEAERLGAFVVGLFDLFGPSSLTDRSPEEVLESWRNRGLA